MKENTVKAVYLTVLIHAVAGCDFALPPLPQDIDRQPVVNNKDITGTHGHGWDSKLDSMLHAEAIARQDTGLVRLYIDIGQLYADNDFEKAKEYYLKARNLSEKLDWNNGYYGYASGFSHILYREGLVDSGIVIVRHAYELAKKENNASWIARTSMNMGNGYFYKSWLETTLEYYQEAMQMLENPDADKETLVKLYDNTGSVYRMLGVFDRAIEYHKKALALFGTEESLLKGTVLYNLASVSQLIRDEQAGYYFNEALRIGKLHNNQYMIASIYLNLGYMVLLEDWKEAENYFLDALEIASRINSPGLTGFVNLNLSLTEMNRLDFEQAKQYCIASLDIADQINNNEYKAGAYRQLAVLHALQHDFSNYRLYIEKSDSVDRFTASVSMVRSSEEMQARYETEKKEIKIIALEEEKRLMTWLSIAGGTVLLLSLAAFSFLWRWTAQKKQLADTYIKQLEQEKQLIATQSVLDGETRERTRLARDLHDGLGSLLTGAKLRLLEMKQGARLEYIDVERFDKALGMLDRSVHEMRRVAHNLMPDSLSRFGLKPAVGDLCSNLPTVRFSYYGDESRLDTKMEVMIYRSIHELVNNAMKHAGAEEIIVQIIQEPDRIAFTVQDNGCGFDPAATTGGIGLQNIRTRIASYNGMLDIDSKVGEGTEINGELRFHKTVKENRNGKKNNT